MNHSKKIEDLFIQYGDDIYTFLIYYTGSKDVEDIVQDVFLKAMRSIDHFEEKSNPKTWLISIARNLVIDKARRSKILQFIPFENDWLKNKQVSFNTPEHIALAGEAQQELYVAIQSLKKRYKDILMLRLIMELSVSETAKVLASSPQSISVTYNRAIKALKKRLDDSEKGGEVVEK
ncbi:sigma-70 family RNA polymerase sigma factor [Bacillus timonensis]|nr:sigma-70 family RNA polymerase sigma factor [Bacillus timonensis]